MHNIIELWHWRVTDKVSRRPFITRHRMTQADALDFDPDAERVPGSQELRQVPTETPGINTSSWHRRDA